MAPEMTDIHVTRAHSLGLEQARALLRTWQPMAEDKLGLRCTLQEAPGEAVMHFDRMGARGQFRATADAFEIACALGLIFKPLRGQFQKNTEAYLDAAIAKAAAKAKAQGQP